jgi:PTS system ascorbate-specific IIA component
MEPPRVPATGGNVLVTEQLGSESSTGELTRLLPAVAVRVAVPAANWRAAVRAAGELLVASGSTTPAYTDEMISTVESLGPYIVIAPGIALAHSRPSPSVLRPGLSLARLAHPVAFGHKSNDPVNLVIGLASPDDNGHVDALATLADLLSDDERRTALLAAERPADMLEQIAKYERSRAESGA